MGTLEIERAVFDIYGNYVIYESIRKDYQNTFLLEPHVLVYFLSETMHV